jgi:hypothetical protein
VEWPEETHGYRAIYRIGFQSMRLPGLPQRLQIGEVFVLQVDGPIITRRTTVAQRPSAPLVWDKTEYASVTVGHDIPLTVGHVAALLPTAPERQANFARWRDEIYAAAGVLACLLDDRVAHAEVFDDFLIYDETGALIGVADQVLGLRNYLPFELSGTDKAAIEHVARLAIPPNALAAARWYLRAAQVGPAADGIPYLWTSLEALTQAEGRQVVNKVENALRIAGENPEALEPGLGPLWGERARIVHFGETEPTELMVNGWYVLERVARTLLRRVLGTETEWPLSPGDTGALPADLREVWTYTPPRTEWHERG